MLLILTSDVPLDIAKDVAIQDHDAIGQLWDISHLGDRPSDLCREVCHLFLAQVAADIRVECRQLL